MSFDEALKRVLDTALQELTVLVGDERTRAREQGAEEGRALGLKDGRDEGRKDGHDEGRAEGLAEGLKEGRAEGREEAARESQAALSAAVAAARAESTVSIAANARLLDAIRSIDNARALGDVLETLAASAAAEAGRAGVLLARNGRLAGWSFHGFGSSLANPSSVDLAIGDTSALAGGRDHIDVPLAIFGETVAVLYADHEESGAANAPHAWRETVEILARHGARALEALTAVKAARSVAGIRPASSDRRSAADEADDPDSSARRYARLLISEIKLYHEAAVVAGRREGDLSSRLGGEISRARVLYEQRVPPAVRNRSDYFRDELVRTLANGDASLLRLS
jgi:hypothetical protein